MVWASLGWFTGCGFVFLCVDFILRQILCMWWQRCFHQLSISNEGRTLVFETIFLCSPCCPGTCSVDQTDFGIQWSACVCLLGIEVLQTLLVQTKVLWTGCGGTHVNPGGRDRQSYTEEPNGTKMVLGGARFLGGWGRRSTEAKLEQQIISQNKSLLKDSLWPWATNSSAGMVSLCPVWNRTGQTEEVAFHRRFDLFLSVTTNPQMHLRRIVRKVSRQVIEGDVSF